jgi:hypothetical protein
LTGTSLFFAGLVLAVVALLSLLDLVRRRKQSATLAVQADLSSTWKAGAYPSHLDLCWLASDRDGHVAAFTTGGQGPVPVEILNRIQQDDLDLEHLAWALPAVSSPPADAQLCESFKGFCERGLFVYDWSDVHRIGDGLIAYERQAEPDVALKVDDLPSNMLEAGRLIRLDVSFEVDRLVDPRLSLACLERAD